MNNSKIFLSLGLLCGICFTYLLVGVFTVFYETKLVESPCRDEDNLWAQNFPDHFVFEKISLMFMKSQCRDNKPLLLISASEGTIPYKFSQAFKDIEDITSWEIRGAHRGIKSLTYILSLAGESERIKNQRIIAFINPVYFGFAARTDDAAMMLSASSTGAFLYNLPHWKYKYRDLILTSPFYGFKNLLEEYSKSQSQQAPVELVKSSPPPRPQEKDYNLKHNMLNDRVNKYKDSFKKDKFSLELEPTATMLQKVITTIKANNLPICLVFLPLNEQQLSTVRDDHKDLVSKLKEQVEQTVPEQFNINLMGLGNKPYLFADSMHLTNWGIHKISQEVVNSDCYKRIIK